MITDPHQLIDLFIKDQDELRDTSKSKYSSMLFLWVEWLIIHGLSWGEVEKVNVVNFKKEMIEKGKSTLYINNFLCILNKFYGWLNDAGHYPKNIAWGIKKCERYKGFRKMILSLPQVEQLLKSIDLKSETGRRDYLIIKLMLTSGLRSVECSRLKVGDFIDKEPYSLMVLGKGKDNKVKVGISNDVAMNIKKYLGRRILKDKHPLFLVWEKAHYDDPMSAAYIGIMVKARMKSAGIDDKLISAHSLRHTYAVSLLRNGASLYEVSALMRHSTQNMTRNYLRFIEEETRLKRKYSDQLETYYETKQVELGFETNVKELYETL